MSKKIPAVSPNSLFLRRKAIPASSSVDLSDGTTQTVDEIEILTPDELAARLKVVY